MVCTTSCNVRGEFLIFYAGDNETYV